MTEDLVKIAVLEQKLVDFTNIVTKLENAIEKISEVNSNITKMLAVHEERIDQCNKKDGVITKIIEETKTDNLKEYKEVLDRVETLEDEIKDITKIKWMTVGIGIVVTILATAFSSLASGMWAPKDMQMEVAPHTHPAESPLTNR